MKINDIKHNHSLTDLLKVGIFSILMCAPLIAIGSTCAYAIVNKNAYQSYYGETINNKQINYVNKTTYKINETYLFQSEVINYEQNTNYNRGTSYLQFQLPKLDDNFPLLEINTTYYLGVYKEASWNYNNWVISSTINGSSIYGFTSNNTIRQIEIQILDIVSPNDILLNTHILGMFTYNSNSYLDNVFYYATEKMTESDLFNWTENTAIFTGVQTMCTQLEIETNVIPILIVYWFILTIIYVIIDIVLKTFTTLTHMLSKETN